MGTGIIDTKYQANKVFTMGGVEYRPGDAIDVSHLTEHKIGQLLNQRFIRPASSSR